MEDCIHKRGRECTLTFMGCPHEGGAQLDCEDYMAPAPEEERESDPCETCERDDCYQILYGRCDRKR